MSHTEGRNLTHQMTQSNFTFNLTFAKPYLQVGKVIGLGEPDANSIHIIVDSIPSIFS